MGMGAGGRDKLQSDINVTPLVDVCLVLLIIFMVVTPMLQKGIDVQLPVTDNPDKKPENSGQQLISIRWASPPQYYFGQQAFSKADFQKQLDELYQRKPNAELVIKADQRLKGMALVRLARLSVQPVSDAEWRIIGQKAGL